MFKMFLKHWVMINDTLFLNNTCKCLEASRIGKYQNMKAGMVFLLSSLNVKLLWYIFFFLKTICSKSCFILNVLSSRL